VRLGHVEERGARRSGDAEVTSRRPMRRGGGCRYSFEHGRVVKTLVHTRPNNDVQEGQITAQSAVDHHNGKARTA
jgi:hypothetical protein